MSGDLYYPLYLTVVVLMTLQQCVYYSQTKCQSIEMRSKTSQTPSFVFAVLVALFIGLRPQHSVFIDMNNYIGYFYHMQGGRFHFDIYAENFIFDNLFEWMATNMSHWASFFLVIATIYFLGMWLCCQKLFPHDTMIAFLTCLGAFSTFSYGTNGVKAGAAASLFLIALANCNNWKLFIPLLALTLGFHHSMTLPLAAFGIAWFYRNTRAYFYAWLASLLIAALHITFFQNFFAGFTDDRGAAYLTATDWGLSYIGFRLDFVLYSSMPVLVGYWALYKKQVKSRIYNFLLSVYLITNSVWMLCMYANFTNRIAYLSWSMYPIVLIYPFFEKDMGAKRYTMLAIAVFLHVMFTVFMQVVYY